MKKPDKKTALWQIFWLCILVLIILWASGVLR